MWTTAPSALASFGTLSLALYWTPAGRENGLPQKENRELFCQPMPGRGLLYTGCPSGGVKMPYLNWPYVVHCLQPWVGEEPRLRPKLTCAPTGPSGSEVQLSMRLCPAGSKVQPSPPRAWR